MYVSKGSSSSHSLEKEKKMLLQKEMFILLSKAKDVMRREEEAMGFMGNVILI